jgi:hypothetical protein
MRSAGQRSGFVKVTAIVLALLMLGSVITLVFMTLATGF